MTKTKTPAFFFLKGKLKNLITHFFGNKDYEKLVILGRQRTGSSLLMMLLHAHSKVDMQSEVFRLLEGKSCKTVWQETFSKKLPWIKYAGFKLFYNHPDDSEDREVWEILNSDTSVKIIHIKRENILRTYISKLVAIKTGAWNSRQEVDKTDVLDKRITVDIAHCLSNLREIKKVESKFDKDRFPNHEYLELTFEALIQNTGSEMKRIFSFLHLKNEKIEKTNVNLKRQNPENMKNLVSNYEEFRESIANSEFADLLKEK